MPIPFQQQAAQLWSLLCAMMEQSCLRHTGLQPYGGRLSVLGLAGLAALLESTQVLLFNHLLAVEEQSVWQRFSSPKRRLEWLGGRLAAKYCLGRYFCHSSELQNIPPQRWVIRNDGQGQPHCISSSHSPAPALSISHSRDYAVALVAPMLACGVDIQLCAEQLFRLRERFAHAAEIALLQQLCPILEQLAIIWVAKEAIKKCWYAQQATFMERITVVAAWKESERLLGLECALADYPGQKIKVRASLWRGYALAVTERGLNA